jgi:hypothetical protein
MEMMGLLLSKRVGRRGEEGGGLVVPVCLRSTG